MNTTCKTSDKVKEMVNFSCEAPGAKTVHLIGDFNSWNHTSDPMQRQADGSWVREVPLSRGRHYYKFLVDGRPVLDPHAMYYTLGAGQEFVSFIALD